MSDRNEVIAATLPDYRRWLHSLAYDIARDDGTHDDLVQEGYIAMWRAFDTYDPDKGALATWLTGAARLRMRDVAYGRGAWTGHEAQRGRKSVGATSLDAILAVEEDLPVLAADLLDGIESAYHGGEIAEALDALSPAQREYVYARFWLGIEPTSRDPQTREWIDQYPVLRRRYLWFGTSKQTGARDRLRARLGHLADLVA